MAGYFGGEAGTETEFQKHKQSFRAEDLEMTLGGKGGDGQLVQQINFTLTRQINTLYEIGSSNVYYVGNRRQGQAQMSRIVGGTAAFKDLLENYGNMCSPKPIVLKAGAAQCKGTASAATPQSLTYELKGATLTTVGASVTAQDIVITENIGFMFLDLDYKTGED
jgi:hypothetical protein